MLRIILKSVIALKNDCIVDGSVPLHVVFVVEGLSTTNRLGLMEITSKNNGNSTMIIKGC